MCILILGVWRRSRVGFHSLQVHVLSQKHHFEIFADYFQFYIQDEPAKGDLGDSWDQEAVDRLLAITDGTIGVGTVRNTTVPVDIEVSDCEPHEPLDRWDQVNECSIDITSGRLVVAGCTDYFPDAARIVVPPGTYVARIYYADLDSLSEDGLEGKDYYRIQLWPGHSSTLRVIKPRGPSKLE